MTRFRQLPLPESAGERARYYARTLQPEPCRSQHLPIWRVGFYIGAALAAFAWALL